MQIPGTLSAEEQTQDHVDWETSIKWISIGNSLTDVFQFSMANVEYLQSEWKWQIENSGDKGTVEEHFILFEVSSELFIEIEHTQEYQEWYLQYSQHLNRLPT